MDFRKKGDKARYSFVDRRCIGRPCWAPGMYQHRSPLSGGGSRNTGSPDTACCMNRAYRGCPHGPEGERKEPCERCNDEGMEQIDAPESSAPEYAPCSRCGGSKELIMVGLPTYDKDKAAQRKREGWKAV